MAGLRCIFDTDAGPDDVMALAWLLGRPDVEIEAITISYGLAHGNRGAVNLSRVAALAGRDIPVHMGREVGGAAFPAAWRTLSDTLPGVDLPSDYRTPEREPAAEFLARRLADTTAGPVSVLALGAMNNLAAACTSHPALCRLVVMGGAFRVAGNVNDSGEFVSPTTTAEWNFFVDPPSAGAVFASDLPAVVIPLDATNHIPLTPAFIDRFRAEATGALGRMTGQVLERIRPYAAAGIYFAWDPLAAVALLHPDVVRVEEHPVAVLDDGTTRRVPQGPVKQIAYGADRERFIQLFLSGFAPPGGPPPT